MNYIKYELLNKVELISLLTNIEMLKRKQFLMFEEINDYHMK